MVAKKRARFGRPFLRKLAGRYEDIFTHGSRFHFSTPQEQKKNAIQEGPISLTPEPEYAPIKIKERIYGGARIWRMKFTAARRKNCGSLAASMLVFNWNRR